MIVFIKWIVFETKRCIERWTFLFGIWLDSSAHFVGLSLIFPRHYISRHAFIFFTTSRFLATRQFSNTFNMNVAGFKFPATNGTSSPTPNGTSTTPASSAATITTNNSLKSKPSSTSPSLPTQPQSYLPLLASLPNLTADQKSAQIAALVHEISTTIVEISKLIEAGTLPSSSIGPLKSFLATIRFPDRQRNAELEAKLKVAEAELADLKEQRRGESEMGSVRMVGAMQELRIEMLKARAETESVRREFETVKGHLEGLKLEREAFVSRIAELESGIGAKSK